MDDLLESEVVYDAIAILCLGARRQVTDVVQWVIPNIRLGPTVTILFSPLVFLPIIALFITSWVCRYKLEKWAWIIAKKLRRWRLRAVAKLAGVGRTQPSLNVGTLFLTSADPNACWEAKFAGAACYAIQGRRPHMEDRFTLQERLPGDRNLALFAIYDGHGGEFAAEYVQKWLFKCLPERILQLSRKPSTKIPRAISQDRQANVSERAEAEINDVKKQPATPLSPRRNNSKNSNTPTIIKVSRTGSNKDNGSTEQEEAESTNSIKKRTSRWPVKDSAFAVPTTPAPQRPREDRWDISQELYQTIMDSDKALLVEAKKNNDVAGSTALVAILDREKGRLAVANVGDSRGVMCDSKGKAIPLSFDHKPQQLKERRRIQEAGGFVTFNGVWRVAGILATSRALGDFPLKDRNLLTAEPDVLTFDLKDHNAQFMILASDGLWDTFSNDEAVAFAKAHIHDPMVAAKNLTTQAYQRGSVDNITVLIVDFKNPSIALT